MTVGNQLIFFSRRYPMLVRMWTDIIDYKVVKTFIPSLCELMASTDIVTKYSSITAMKKIVKLSKDDALPLADILNSAMPAVLYICDRVSQPQLVWPVITILTNVMEKCSSSGIQSALMIERLNMDKLLEKNDKLIRSALIEMFKTIVVAAPFGSPMPSIFNMSLRFLQMSLPKIEEYDTEELAFWHFVAKELSKIPEHEAVIATHFQMLNSMLPAAVERMEDSLQLQLIVNILEESVLLDSNQITFE